MTKPFIPTVTRTKHVPSAPVRAWAQERADAAYERLRTGADGLETDAVVVCASKGAVAPHRDVNGTSEGMRVVGLVIRSDGHRLHSDNLKAAGMSEGILLEAGMVYAIDPFDRHWTTVPDDHPDAELIFSVHIMFPDGRTANKLGHDMWWSLLAASIESRKNAA